MPTPAVLRALEAATRGLLFPSETDAPFSVRPWPGPEAPTTAALLAAHGLPAGAPVETTTARELVAPLLGPDGGDDAPRFRALVELVERELADAAAYRLGATDLVVLVVGRAREGAWIVLETRAVES
jgi:hypothetical protein